jgi:hemoglobin
MKTDITSRADIDALMLRFYGRAMSDPIIGYLFTDVAKLDLEHHLPVIGDFWESVLFGTGVYAKHGRHPLLIHKELDRKSPLDESFAGGRAEYIRQRSHAIANRMQEFVSTGQ